VSLQEPPVNVKGDLRQSVGRKKLDLGRITAGSHSAIENFGGVAENEDRPVHNAAHAVNVQQEVGTAHQSGLLLHFADHRLLRVLIFLNESAGKTPAPQSGLDVAFHQKNATFPLQNGRD
jgi:hypothetical protein